MPEVRICRADVVWVKDDGDDEQGCLELQMETRCSCPYCCKQYASMLMQAVMVVAEEGKLDIADIVKTACDDVRRQAGQPAPH